jgi:hypothetical protein
LLSNTKQRWQQSAISTAPIAGTNRFTLELRLRRRSKSFVARLSSLSVLHLLVSLASVPRVADVWSRRLMSTVLSQPQKGRASDSLDPHRSTLQPVNAPTIKHPCVELVCKKDFSRQISASARLLQDLLVESTSEQIRSTTRAKSAEKKFASLRQTVT